MGRAFLEVAAVTKKVRENYGKRMAELEKFFTHQKVNFKEDAQEL